MRAPREGLTARSSSSARESIASEAGGAAAGAALGGGAAWLARQHQQRYLAETAKVEAKADTEKKGA